MDKRQLTVTFARIHNLTRNEDYFCLLLQLLSLVPFLDAEQPMQLIKRH
jgi:hypothetical protein